MIVSLRGEIQEKGSQGVIVEVSGVGYLVRVSRQTLLALDGVGASCFLWTYFHVREDRQQLFGFGQLDEKKAFEILLTVKGVGPRLALAILSELSPAGLGAALSTGQSAQLNKLPGVGKKLAERLTVELKDKASELAGGGQAELSPRLDLASHALEQALSALQNLGFSSSQARQAVENAHQTLGTKDPPVEDIVKMALKLI